MLFVSYQLQRYKKFVDVKNNRQVFSFVNPQNYFLPRNEEDAKQHFNLIIHRSLGVWEFRSVDDRQKPQTLPTPPMGTIALHRLQN